MRDIQALSSACFLLMLTEKEHVHEIRVDHIQIPDPREESLTEYAMKNVQIRRQLIGLLLSYWVYLHSVVGSKGLLVGGWSIAVRTETDRSLKPVIHHIK